MKRKVLAAALGIMVVGGGAVSASAAVAHAGPAGFTTARVVKETGVLPHTSATTGIRKAKHTFTTPLRYFGFRIVGPTNVRLQVKSVSTCKGVAGKATATRVMYGKPANKAKTWYTFVHSSTGQVLVKNNCTVQLTATNLQSYTVHYQFQFRRSN
jgi:hypothetical protein